jgi:AcrR family transcriptional regulator
MSATATKWEVRRVETTRRLERCALELTRDRGFDGWTMDDLATAADVSRRTVFNYFDGKADVILGRKQELSEEAAATFVAGGPTGHVFDDLVEVAKDVLRETGLDIDLELLRRQVARTDPHVVAIAHERFEEHIGGAVDLILQREGESYGVARARLLISLLRTVFDSILDRTGDDLTRPLPELIDEAVAVARAVLTD